MQVRISKIAIHASVVSAALIVGALLGPSVLPTHRADAQDPTMGAAPMTASESTETVDVLRAKRFELVDNDGRRKAMLYVSSNGEPLFFMYDRNGKMRMSLAMLDGQPGLDIRDRNGKSRLSLYVAENGPEIQVLDDERRTRVSLSCFDGDEGSVVLRDGRGTIVFRQPDGKDMPGKGTWLP